MTDIFRNGTQYTCSSVIQNGVEYTLGGGNCDEEIYKANMEANIFAPLSYTVEDAYAPGAGLYPYQYWYERDGIISDTMYTSIRIAFLQVTSSSRRYDCIYANKEFRKDCTAGSFVIYSGSFNSGKMLGCATFVKEGTALTSLCDKKIENSTYRRVASVYDFTLDGTVTETVLGTWDYDDKSVYQTDEQFETAMLVLYQNHLESLSTVWGEQKQAALISRQDLSNGTTSNHYNVILQGVNPYVYPPTIEGDNYIDLTTNGACNLPISAAVYYSIDDEEVAKYVDTSISIPAGSHTVRIIPYNATPGWAIGFQLKTGVTSITHDAPFSAYNVSTTTVADNYRKDFAKGCTTLTSVPSETMTIPNTVTSIGNNFMASMFEGCTGLTEAFTATMPNTVTTVGDYYLSRQYYGCTGITEGADESVSSALTSIGGYYMNEMYSGCTALEETANEVMSNSVTTIGNNFRASQYGSCTSLTTVHDEQLSSTLTSIGNYFRVTQFNGCSSITTTGTESLPNTISSIGNNFRSFQYSSCTSLTSIKGWKDLSVGGSSYRNNQFSGCNANKTVKVLTDVGYNSSSGALNNTYVTEVQVPTAYLQNFIDATSYPRRSITDSKFVGY